MEEELSEEKVAQDSLISVLCDSCVHLGADGDTLIRSTPCFDNLMQHRSQGTALRDCFPSEDGEQERFADALARSKMGTAVALPVTLVSRQKVLHRVDLFIVYRRGVGSHADNADCGFLLGIQINQCNVQNSSSIPTPLSLTSKMELPSYKRLAASGKWLNSGPESCGRASSVGLGEVTSVSEMQDAALDAELFSQANSLAANSAPAEMTNRVHQRPIAGSLQECEGGDCLPKTAQVWVESCTLPKSIDSILPGDRILCYDNLANGLSFAPVVTAVPAKHNPTSDSVTVTMADGSVLTTTADHPLAIQSEARDLNRGCVRACDLQAGNSLMMLRIDGVKVTSVEHSSKSQVEENGSPLQAEWMTITMAQPERHEILVASQEQKKAKSFQARAIAVGSCDRALDDHRALIVKNTFLHSREHCGNSSCHRSTSAPPRLAHSKPSLRLEGTSSAAHKPYLQTENSSEVMNIVSVIGKSSTSGMPSNSGKSIESESNSEHTSESMSEPSDKCNASSVKLGFPVPSEPVSVSRARLSDIRTMKSNGLDSAGSCHVGMPCSPCSFHFCHLRWPDTRTPCKAKFMCEFCHDVTHNPEWRAMLRKNRRPKAFQATVPALVFR